MTRDIAAALSAFWNTLRRRISGPVALVTLTGVLTVTGLAVRPVSRTAADGLWLAATAIALLPAAFWVWRDLRKGRYGADLLALLALAGSAAVGEYFAGALIALMVATGRVLEAYAARRAGADLSELLRRAPAQAHRRTVDGVETVRADAVVVGDTVVVLPGEVVPVDGMLATPGVFDESALTGESAPVVRRVGTPVRSGVVNAGAAVDIRATAVAEASTYAGITALARQAAAEVAPVARLADRVAVWFLPLALGVAGAAWAFSGSAVRAVAVIVTATPCPLLLAVPVAITAGMSRTARAGVVVKNGAALETLGRASTLVMDKTGTVTVGRPEVVDIRTAPGVSTEDVLRQAAAVEHLSPHVLAHAVTTAAALREIPIVVADNVSEIPGEGATGIVAGHRIRVGKRPADADLAPWAEAAARQARLDLASIVWVCVDEIPLGALLVRDRLRNDAARTMRRLRTAGLRRLVLLTGDRVENATDAASALQLTEVIAEADPADKIAAIRAERRAAVTVMVGDGVNDAPALAAADVGIALGARGSTAAVQAADAVIVDDRIDRLADAVDIAQRSHRLAVQSAAAGMAMSLAAMVAAATGYLAPSVGALVQEAIDIAVILNALRALRTGAHGRATTAIDPLVARFEREHDRMHTARESVREAADALADGPTAPAEAAVRRAVTLLTDQVLPHEHAEEHELYPALSGYLRDPEALVTMSREHTEIERLIARLHRHLDSATTGLRADQIDDLRATLYGLDAILTLHFAQEDEALFTLAR
ncbi:heavy metal translocating P-type ATPase [Nocardia sp. CDC160]|uniref:heavy metal translocating P-type ATPase n=1 Tax=Nocardia sp. CDC160 TaxID=3112166 RepID=UPI002DB8E799|nr:heavy metal translocating P-type ATPase [Nocardia sp. CDC160]MEC3918687.1 heavy metal translocating P-type ATPase [Nocardia sp. CDC160]